MAVVSDSCVTLMTSLLIRMGSTVIMEGGWTQQEAENRAKIPGAKVENPAHGKGHEEEA